MIGTPIKLNKQAQVRLDKINETIIEKQVAEAMGKVALMIDKSMGIVIYPKPSYCPKWLYEKIIRDSVSIVEVKK